MKKSVELPGHAAGKALVTGGAGAIGGRLVRRLLKEGWEVDVVDDLSSGFSRSVPPEVKLRVASILDPGFLAALGTGDGYDLVVHLAALFANQNSVEHPEEDLAVNASGTLKILLALRDAPWRERLRRFVYSSSSCVYGSATGLMSEQSALRPETPYAISKLAGEQYARFFFEQYGLPCVSLRLFNSFGPGEFPGRYRNVVPNFVAAALAGRPLRITGTGLETRDFTFVEDLVEGFLRASLHPAAVGEVFNIGTGREVAIGDLARRIVAITNSKSEVELVGRRDWDKVARRCADISKARQVLEFSPEKDLDEGLRETAEWLASSTAVSERPE